MTRPVSGDHVRRTRAVTILGAGPAGLATAVWALRAGMEPRVFEAQGSVGGNARTFQVGRFRYDSGAHRLHAASAPVMALLRELCAGALHTVDAPSQIRWRDRSLGFPPALLDAWRALGPRRGLRAARDLLAARMCGKRPGEEASFEAQARYRYGHSLARMLLLDYSEKLWGLPAAQLSARVAGGRLRGFDVRGVLHELLGRRPTHLEGRFLYPRGGFGQLCTRMAEALGPERITLDAPVQRVFHQQGSLRAIQVGGRELAVERVVSTLPLPALLRCLQPSPPAEILRLASGLRFRNLRLLALFLARPRVGPCASLYFPERELPFTRVVEPKNRCPSLAPPDQTALVVELPCWPEDALWRASEQELCARVVPLLAERGLLRPEELCGSRAHSLSHAYPVLELSTPATLARLGSWLRGLCKLHLVGRNAGFEYGHVHDWLEQSRLLVQNWR